MPNDLKKESREGAVRDNAMLQGTGGAVVIVVLLFLITIAGVLIWGHAHPRQDKSRSSAPAGMALRL